MKFSLPTAAQVSAFGRHIVSYAAGATTVGVALHVLNPDQANQLTAGVTGIVNGINSIVGGAATLFALGAALYAARTASPTAQITAVAANPDVTKIVAMPDVAKAIPSDKVISPFADIARTVR